MNQIPNIIPFPDGAESSPFFGALASVLIPALGITEEVPYFCDPKQSFCMECGSCNRTTLQKHRNRLYHDYQSFTGISLGWAWPEEVSEYQTMPGWYQGWRWPDEFFAYIFGYAGLAWKRLKKGTAKDGVLAAVRTSVDARIPILLKLGSGPDWHVVTGYDDGGTLYGLDSHKHFDRKMHPTNMTVDPQKYTDDGLFILQEWYPYFQDAVIITGRAEKSITFSDILARMIHTLEHPAHKRLENDVMSRLDDVTAENSWESAQWLLNIVSFPIEGRFHAAESSIHHICMDKNGREKLSGMIRQYVFDSELDATHGTCWKIWAQLGVGTETDYTLPPNAGRLLMKKETQTELRRLFKIVFINDRKVLELLREAAQATSRCFG